jgi:hypothetical protein
MPSFVNTQDAKILRPLSTQTLASFIKKTLASLINTDPRVFINKSVEKPKKKGGKKNKKGKNCFGRRRPAASSC